VNAINNFFNLGMKENWYPASIPSPADGLNINIDCKNKTPQEVICEAVLKTYDIRNDDRNLRSSPETFEEQRGNYPVRREFHNYYLNLVNSNDEINKIAAGFQFKLTK